MPGTWRKDWRRIAAQAGALVLILAVLGLVAYWVATAYNPSADQVIVRVDFAYLGGAPEAGEICTYPDVPEIRVWGDGLAYYREIIHTTLSEPKSRWGRLSPDEVRGVIRELWLRGLFTDFEIGAPNPAGNTQEFAVQLLWFSHHRDLASNLSSQSGASRAYKWLVEYLGSKLAVFEPGTSGEPRIDGLNLDRDCVLQPTIP